MVRRSVEWGSRMFGICLPDEEKGFTDHGTIVEIQATESFPTGKLVVQAIPKQRFRVVTRNISDGCPKAKVEWLEDARIDDYHAVLHLKWRNSLSHYMLKRWLAALPHDEKVCLENSLGPIPPSDSHLLLSPNGSPWLWWSLAAIPISAQEKLRILLMPHVADRLQSIQDHLEALLKSNNDRDGRNVTEESSDSCHALTIWDSSFQQNTVIWESEAEGKNSKSLRSLFCAKPCICLLTHFCVRLLETWNCFEKNPIEDYSSWSNFYLQFSLILV